MSAVAYSLQIGQGLAMRKKRYTASGGGARGSRGDSALKPVL
jgi:hypothetical protein